MNFTKQHEELLEKGLQQLKIRVSVAETQKLLKFLSLLALWNKTYNLTAITCPKQMIIQHILDSLAINPFIKAKNVIDVGTGPGIPGIPLAIINPQVNITLLDSLNKRCKFLRQAIHELELSNANVVHSRVEKYKPLDFFDQVVTRAFASAPSMMEKCKHLGTKKTQFLAMKGSNVFKELDEIKDLYTIVGVHALKVPYLHASRHLLILEE